MLFLVGRRFTGAAKALTYGAAAGLGYGLQAAVTKTFVTELGGGALGLLSSWSMYVLVVSAVTGFALQQSSLKTGVLAPAMASSNSVTLFSSVILGIAVYGETLSKTGTSHCQGAAPSSGLPCVARSSGIAHPLAGYVTRREPRGRAGRPGGARAHLAATMSWWEYVVLFAAVAASWAGVPVIGATAWAAGVAASQGKLNLALVIVVATAAGEVGGLIGYAIGNRWGRELLERPGKHQAGRRRIIQRGEQAYARWGRVAVFFTPPIVSGTAKMQHGQFVLWNLLASFAFSVAVAASSYGFGRIFTGHYSPRDISTLLVGLAVGTLVTVVFVAASPPVRRPTGRLTRRSAG